MVWDLLLYSSCRRAGTAGRAPSRPGSAPFFLPDRKSSAGPSWHGLARRGSWHGLATCDGSTARVGRQQR
eukprot:scaffold8645_cov62-Phaeocystis_antarctica.AAC.2